jgi:hypothetical protein
MGHYCKAANHNTHKEVAKYFIMDLTRRNQIQSICSVNTVLCSCCAFNFTFGHRPPPLSSKCNLTSVNCVWKSLFITLCSVSYRHSYVTLKLWEIWDSEKMKHTAVAARSKARALLGPLQHCDRKFAPHSKNRYIERSLNGGHVSLHTHVAANHCTYVHVTSQLLYSSYVWPERGHAIA